MLSTNSFPSIAQNQADRFKSGKFVDFILRATSARAYFKFILHYILCLCSAATATTFAIFDIILLIHAVIIVLPQVIHRLGI